MGRWMAGPRRRVAGGGVASAHVRTSGARHRAAAVVLAGLAMLSGGCEAQPRALEQGSRSPSLPRVPSGATFQPRIGDLTTFEIFEVSPDRMTPAAETMVSVVLPVIRERGGLREVWMTRDDTNARFVIASVWAEPVSFQQWQMSEERLRAYQALGPLLRTQPSVQTVSLIGVVARPLR